MTSDMELKCVDRLEALCQIAGSNFPRETDVNLSVDGDASCSIRLPAWFLSTLIKRWREQWSPKPVDQSNGGKEK